MKLRLMLVAALVVGGSIGLSAPAALAWECQQQDCLEEVDWQICRLRYQAGLDRCDHW